MQLVKRRSSFVEPDLSLNGFDQRLRVLLPGKVQGLLVLGNGRVDPPAAGQSVTEVVVGSRRSRA